MTYFNLRKRESETEPEEVEEQQPEETEDEHEEETPAKTYGPIATGLLGPGRWTAARFGIGWAWGIHAVAVWAIGFYGGWTAVGIVFAWLAAVLAFVPREFKDRASGWLERRGTSMEVDEAADEETLVDPLAVVLWHLIADAPGTHLKTLTERLQKESQEPLDKAAVKAKLGALNIPLRGSVRDAAGKVNEGVHRDDLKAWQEALPDRSSGAAPESRSSPVAGAVTCDVADAPTVVATPLSALRKLLPRGGT
jgi:hypothetical protein